MFDILLSYFSDRVPDRVELEGVYEVGDGRSGARVHQAWLPSDASEAELKWVCVTGRIAGWGQAGGRVGWVTLMHPGSVGFFHQALKYTHTHTMFTHKGAHINTCSCCLPALALNTLTFRPRPGTAEKL